MLIQDEIVLNKIDRIKSFLKILDPDGIGREDCDYYEYVKFCRTKFKLT